MHATKNGCLMPGCLTKKRRLGRLNKTEAWMHANKRRPGCMTKNGCMHKNVLYPYYTVIYRIIPYNMFGHLAVAMGKRLVWATLQNSENQKNMFAWATWQLRWAKGGRVACQRQECRNTHVQSRGGGGHQPYSKHS